jgi:regulator of cell morphogenesis and NO signaling
MTTTPDLSPQTTLASLAATRAGASRVFQRHGLDFCCNGRIALADACAAAELDVDAMLDELRREAADQPAPERWDDAPLDAVIDHILTRYHEPHRAELPRLVEMARKVERVHGDKPSCPHGLATHVERMLFEMESHMQKEEQILFPMIRAGRGRMALMPVQVMEQEHRDHGENLALMRKLASDFVAPEEACNTWRALYLGLAELESELMAHISLENHVLFPRALRS